MTPACLTTDRSAPDGRLATYARSLAGAGYGGGESELARWALAVSSSREAGTAQAPKLFLVLHRFGATLVFFYAPYFKKRVREVAATHPGINWFIVDGSTINSIDSTGAAMLEALSEDFRARGIRLGFAKPPNRGLRLFGTLRSEGCTRRWCAIHHTQISRGCLRLWRVRRNIGNRNRTIAGTRTQWIPVPATRLTPHTGDPCVALCAKEIHYRSVALLTIYM
jgi:anti-anti-sigma regulatory factor